jgi:hypothetical protein
VLREIQELKVLKALQGHKEPKGLKEIISEH